MNAPGAGRILRDLAQAGAAVRDVRTPLPADVEIELDRAALGEPGPSPDLLVLVWWRSMRRVSGFLPAARCAA